MQYSKLIGILRADLGDPIAVQYQRGGAVAVLTAVARRAGNTVSPGHGFVGTNFCAASNSVIDPVRLGVKSAYLWGERKCPEERDGED